MAEWKVPAAPVLRRRFLAGASGPGTWGGLAVEDRSCDLFWARNALHLGLRSLGVAPGSRVLVPAYICRSVPEAVLAHGAEVEFYRVDEECRLDLDDLAGRIRPPVSGVIAVHYFGLPQPDMQALRTLCDERKVVLIEDCAHVLPVHAGPGHPGFIGHASVFSWRKFLPVFDGGTLVLNSGSATGLPSPLAAPVRLELRACKDSVDRLRARSVGSADPEVGQSIAMSLPAEASYRCGQIRAEVRSGGSTRMTMPSNLRLSVLRMTCASRWIRDYSDLLAVAENRRRNWRALADLLPPEVRAEPFCDAPLSDIGPWVFPLRLGRLEDPCRRLRELGIPAAGWSGCSTSQPPGRPVPSGRPAVCRSGLLAGASGTR